MKYISITKLTKGFEFFQIFEDVHSFNLILNCILILFAEIFKLLISEEHLASVCQVGIESYHRIIEILYTASRCISIALSIHICTCNLVSIYKSIHWFTCRPLTTYQQWIPIHISWIARFFLNNSWICFEINFEFLLHAYFFVAIYCDIILV